jgi:hypothetical protein
MSRAVSFGMTHSSCRSLLAGLALLSMAVPLAACNVDVKKHESDGKADVDITTPVGNVSVRTNVGAADTGLAVYPGSRPLEDDKEPRNANVQVGNSMFGVNVVAAKYESSDPQHRIVDFYRNELKTYGDVLECRGNVNYRGGRPVCREKAFEDALQLVAGPEGDQRIVAVKARGDGTEFGLVHVQTRGKD